MTLTCAGMGIRLERSDWKSEGICDLAPTGQPAWPASRGDLAFVFKLLVKLGLNFALVFVPRYSCEGIHYRGPKDAPVVLPHQCGDNGTFCNLYRFFRFEEPKNQSWDHKVWNFRLKKHQLQRPELSAGQLLLKVGPRLLTWLYRIPSSVDQSIAAV